MERTEEGQVPVRHSNGVNLLLALFPPTNRLTPEIITDKSNLNSAHFSLKGASHVKDNYAISSEFYMIA